MSGRLSDIVLGYQDIDSYLKHCRDSDDLCLGATLGRMAGPVKNCQFTLDRSLTVSCKKYGAMNGLSTKNWKSSIQEDSSRYHYYIIQGVMPSHALFGIPAFAHPEYNIDFVELLKEVR